MDRLTNVVAGSGIGNSSIVYDTVGNITQYTTSQQSLDYVYNTNNQLVTVNKVDAPQVEQLRAFSYDNRGNVTSNGFRSFGFNIANQLQGSLDNNYLYDGHNRRVRQTDSQGTSYSMYSQDGTLLYRETDDGPINYIYLGKKLIAKDGFVADKSADQHFYPYGSSVEGEVDDIGYTGHKFDKDLGLVYMQARYYDPMIGRFYSDDPVGSLSHLSTLNGVQGFNRYAYANNNPYKYTDPTGLCSESSSSSEIACGVEDAITNALEPIIEKIFAKVGVTSTSEGERDPNGDFAHEVEANSVREELIAITILAAKAKVGGKRGKHRTKTKGANKLDKKQVNDAARQAGITDRKGFGKFLEAQKKTEGRGGSDNFTYDELVELANDFKRNGE